MSWYCVEVYGTIFVILQQFYLECPEGRFGSDCLQDCDCAESKCDSATGICICPPGKIGKNCSEGRTI